MSFVLAKYITHENNTYIHTTTFSLGDLWNREISKNTPGYKIVSLPNFP